jgi:response regulator RpfG family c-di-GMP phosphodiesterase
LALRHVKGFALEHTRGLNLRRHQGDISAEMHSGLRNFECFSSQETRLYSIGEKRHHKSRKSNNARELGLDEGAQKDIEIAALHDIGKVGIPDAILNKPARLTEEEYALMKKHPEYGWAVLRQIPGMERASLIILHHHESFDWLGIPG